jgi:helicase MOV-10
MRFAELRYLPYSGDGVLLQRRDQPDGRWYEGVVHDVRRDAVGLRFPPSFQVSPTMRYSVRFTFNRFPLRRQHQALNRPFMDDRIFFPVAMHVRTAQTPLPAIELYNGLIAANPNQLLAVKTIVSLPPAAHPFIVFGPYVFSPDELPICTNLASGSFQAWDWKGTDGTFTLDDIHADCHYRRLQL